MSSDKDRREGNLVPSGKREIKKYSSKLISRGLGLIELVEKKEKCDMLIIEDEETLRYMIEMMIRNRFPNLKIQSAEDGLEGLEKAQEFKPRIIWTCVKMPRMDGLEMIGRIRRNPDFKNTKIIVCSANWSEDVRNRAFELGVNTYLRKPFTQNEALSAIGSCFEVENGK